MNFCKKIPALGLALLMTGVVTVTAFAASADPVKVIDDKGNPITADTISVTADEKNPVTVGSITATDDKGNPITLDSIGITIDEGKLTKVDSISAADEKGNPIQLDSITIEENGSNCITMKSLGFTASDLEGKDTITVNQEAWIQK